MSEYSERSRMYYVVIIFSAGILCTSIWSWFIIVSPGGEFGLRQTLGKSATKRGTEAGRETGPILCHQRSWNATTDLLEMFTRKTSTGFGV